MIENECHTNDLMADSLHSYCVAFLKLGVLTKLVRGFKVVKSCEFMAYQLRVLYSLFFTLLYSSGSARSMLSNRDVSGGSKLVKDIKNHEGQGVYVFSPL